MKNKAIIIILVIIGCPIIFCIIGALFISYIWATIGFILGIGFDAIFLTILKSITHGEKIYEEFENIGRTSNRQNN